LANNFVCRIFANVRKTNHSPASRSFFLLDYDAKYLENVGAFYGKLAEPYLAPGDSTARVPL